jgi:peptide/nickel transport system permease protein
MKKFFKHPANWIALALIGIYLIAAAAAPWLAPPRFPDKFSPYQTVAGDKARLPMPPRPEAPFGSIPTATIASQLDIYYTVIWGIRPALTFGLVVALTTALIGVVIGATGAFFGGMVNNLVLRITDAFLAFPLIVGVILVQDVTATILNPQAAISGVVGQASSNTNLLGEILSQIDPMMLAFICFLWMPYARITNTLVLRLTQTDFVQAARALGAGPGWIITRHLLPNSISPAMVLVARDIGLVVLLQASFTFIGVGGDSAWGSILAVGRRWIIGLGGNPFRYWWAFIPATLALVFFGMGWNLLGDGLNDWLNPKQS